MRYLLWAPFFILGVVSQAEASPPCRAPVRVALHNNGALYDGERGSGIDVAFVSAVADRLGCPVLFQALPRTQVWSDLVGVKVDLAPSALMTSDRIAKAHFLPYLRNKPLTFLRPSAEEHEGPMFASRSSLKLGVIKAFAYGPSLDGLVARIRSDGPNRIAEATLPSQLLPLLINGKVDGILVNPLQIGNLTAAIQDQHLTIRDWAPHETAVGIYLALARERFSDSDAKAWADAIEAVRTDGSLKTILEQYLPVEVVPALLAPL